MPKIQSEVHRQDIKTHALIAESLSTIQAADTSQTLGTAGSHFLISGIIINGQKYVKQLQYKLNLRRSVHIAPIHAYTMEHQVID